MQSSKIIDVTRSFIPIDPNSYPENLHATEKEDSPEKRFPVVPYIGHNFMPTHYGYRSYFGTNSALGVDDLAPNKPQHVFIFQNLTYKNVLIALCDTGIWLKNAGTAGAWTQSITLTPLADDIYYEWTFAIIQNVLYCFRGNGAVYYKIVSDGSAIGVVITSPVPTFITPTAQLGMFRLGSRLAFWDGTNAIAWSSPDDLTDFEPAVLTGANVTTFNSVTGKISSIRTHGNHAIVYATKSVILLEVAPAETFFVKATPILTDTGVAYMSQTVAATPDTTHFAYTDTGVYKIERGTPELIVPEVFDYFKTYTASPVYLNFLQGRYLCFEILDPRLINGNVQFSTVVIPDEEFTFEIESLEDLLESDPEGVDICEAVAAYDDGTYDEQEEDAAAAVPPAARKPGSDFTPIYSCWISDANGPAEIASWTHVPCGGVYWGGGSYLMSPNTDAGKLSKWTTTSTNKTAKDGRDVWVDGIWTIQRFVQYQSAIWRRQERAMAEFIAEIVTRSEPSETLVTGPINTCAALATDIDECTIGRYPTEFSDYQFGINRCSFWLTRYALGASDIINTHTRAITCDTDEEFGDVAPYRWYSRNYIGTEYGPFSSKAGALGAFIADPVNAWIGGSTLVENGDTSLGGSGLGGSFPNEESLLNAGYYTPTVSGNICYLRAVWAASPTGKTKYNRVLGTPPTVGQRLLAGYAMETRTSSSVNSEEVIAPGVLGVETAYCELIGYKWTNLAGEEQFTAVAACASTADKYPGSEADPGTRQVPEDAAREEETDQVSGSFCGIPFEPPDLEVPDPPIEWEDQTIVYAGTSFLLQQGSIAPVYPTKYGAFVYDLHLKKWGKLKNEFKHLFDYSPVNSSEGSIVSFDVFGVLAGLVKADGFIYLFDNDPDDSLLTWGKIGYYRAGMSDLQEVHMHFASMSNGTVTIDASIDGQNVATDLSYNETFNATSVVVYPPYSGKWYNISLSGKWDISYLETKATLMKGRR